MASNEKTLTMGTKLTLKKVGSESADLIIGAITSIGEITGEREEIDVTTLDSVGGNKEYIAGAADWGTQDIEAMVQDRTQLTKLRALFDAKTIRDWEIETPAKDKQTYKAFIQNFTYGEKTIEGVDTFKMTLRISGNVTFTAGA